MEACVEAAPHPPPPPLLARRSSANPEKRAVSAAERWRAAACSRGLRGPGERLCDALRLRRHNWDLLMYTRRLTYSTYLPTD